MRCSDCLELQEQNEYAECEKCSDYYSNCYDKSEE